MQHIESVMDSLEFVDLGETFFDVAWDHTYFQDEMDKSQRLGSMITFTGSVDAAWAATSKEYVEKIWPETGMVTLSAIEKAMKQDKIGCYYETFSSFDGDFGVEVRRSRGPQIKVQGSKRQTVQVAQQLAWMMGVFQTRKDRDSDKTMYSHFQIDNQDTDRFSLSPLPLKEASESNASCWPSLLHGGVISHGFPIPQRGSEVGVEMSLDAIIPLAGIQYPVHIQDVTIMKGWSTLLYPVKASVDFGSIQWHLVACDVPDDPRILQALSSVAYVANWKDVGLDSIRMSRSFIGFCDSANIHLGTKMFEPQRSEDVSGALIETSRAFWQKKVTVNMGTAGMGAFGFGAAGEIGFTKTTVARMAERENFDKVLDLSRGTAVIMYDVATSLAWLVPEISVVLHMTRSWFLERKDLARNEIEKLPSAAIAEDGGSAAMNAIRKHQSLDLERTGGTSTWKFMDIVKDSVRLLRACRDTKDRSQSSSSVSYLLSRVQSPRLYGWDMADMIDGRDNTSRKEISVHKNSNDRWVTSIANHPDVLLLFCRNIAAPIRPAQPEQTCRKWNPMPSGENYLVASVQSLKDLARHCNGGDKGRKLTDKCYWSRPSGSNPWGPCDYESRKGCNRLQQIVDQNPNRPVKLHDGGAIVFGRNASPRKRCRLPKSSSPEKGLVATDGISDETAGSISTMSLPFDSLSVSQRDQRIPVTVDDNDRAPVPVSSSGGEMHQGLSFEEDCRAIAAALAQRHDKQPSPVEIDELIQEGRAIYDQFRHQAQKLQKQKVLVDEMLPILRSTKETVTD